MIEQWRVQPHPSEEADYLRIRYRDRMNQGLAKYGNRFVGDPLVHLEEELLDALHYLRAARRERAEINDPHVYYPDYPRAVRSAIEYVGEHPGCTVTQAAIAIKHHFGEVIPEAVEHIRAMVKLGLLDDNGDYTISHLYNSEK